VQITGIADVGLQSNDYKGNKVSGINNNGSSTSQIDIIVTEDLGGGLKANFFSESDVNFVQAQGNSGWASSLANGTNSGAGSWMNSETKVGLSGAFGAINAGVVNAQQLTAVTTGQPFGTAISSGYGSILKASAGTAASSASVVRFDNSVRYETPVFSGFSGVVYYAGKQTQSNNSQVFSTTLGAYDRAGVNELSLKYANGPLNAIYSSQKMDYSGVTVPGALTANPTAGQFTGVAGTAGTAKVTMNSLAANYTYGAFTFGAINQTLKDDLATAAVNTSANLVSVKYVNGVHTVGLTSGSLTNKVTDKKSTFTGVGYDYALSKMTAVYARAETLTDDGGTVAAVSGFTEVGTKRTRQALGLRIAF
jgi:predicted porin